MALRSDAHDRTRATDLQLKIGVMKNESFPNLILSVIR